jgi:threonine synthase
LRGSTAATAAAAPTNLLRDGTIAAAETIIMVLTGHGLEAAERIGELVDDRAQPIPRYWAQGSTTDGRDLASYAKAVCVSKMGQIWFERKRC